MNKQKIDEMFAAQQLLTQFNVLIIGQYENDVWLSRLMLLMVRREIRRRLLAVVVIVVAVVVAVAAVINSMLGDTSLPTEEILHGDVALGTPCITGAQQNERQ